jgi:hypothetical protein
MNNLLNEGNRGYWTCYRAVAFVIPEIKWFPPMNLLNRIVSIFFSLGNGYFCSIC